jgi:DNA-binding CsgD family transcriptional regulator
MTRLVLRWYDDSRDSKQSHDVAGYTCRINEGISSLLQIDHSCLNDIWYSLRQPALLVGTRGLVVDMTTEAIGLFDEDFSIRQRRISIRDPEARAKIQYLVEQLDVAFQKVIPSAEPIIVRRRDKFPMILRIWRVGPGARRRCHDIRALVTLNTLGPRPGPAAANLAKAFGLTPSEARLACTMTRGAGTAIAAKELNISRETARKQLQSIFTKTGTHRQGELVALLMQIP